jgi:ATP-dependent DNA helicase DinG
MSTLMRILDHIGFNARPQQVALFEALEATDEVGSVMQAGTGTGKSLAVLAAAADWARRTGQPSLVVVPTNILLRQYIKLDAPRVEQALGITIKSLMGRNRYLCSSAPGFAGLTRLPDHVIAAEPEQNQLLHGDEIVEAADPYWFGCPGSDECRYKEDGEVCHYRMAKEELPGADIIITNAHLLIIDDQLKSKPEGAAQIFPDFGALFVDECHTLEDSLRSFATRSIPRQAVLGLPLASWLRTRAEKDALTITPDRYLVEMLSEVKDQHLSGLKKHQKEARQAAEYILQRGANGAYREGEAVLWLDPPHGQGGQPRLVSTQINLAGGARRILTKVPFGLVSGTVPGSLRNALGISDAMFIDVGHPFDYSKQVELKISPWSGAYQQAKSLDNKGSRASEMWRVIVDAGGGALCLFSSYKDMESVYESLVSTLANEGLDVRSQTHGSDNKELGEWFKSHGNAVLFGTESFATGFDVPGAALRLVAIWKLPYPGLDPVTRAISNRSRRRYEDMMLMKVTQAAGRLIRTAEDTGTIFIADSRAQEKLLGRDDPMIAHFNDMVYTPRAVREDY